MRYSIAPRFVETVLAGSQDYLITPERAIGHAAAGDEIELCVGNLRGAPVLRAMCAGVSRLRLVLPPVIELVFSIEPVIEIEIDDEKIPPTDLEAFARRCGFVGLRDLVASCSRSRAREWSGFLLSWDCQT